MENELRILRGLGRIAFAVEASGFSEYATDLLQIRHELRECYFALLDDAAGADHFEWDEEMQFEDVALPDCPAASGDQPGLDLA